MGIMSKINTEKNNCPMKKFFFSIIAAALVMPTFAEDNNKFESDEKLESGFFTSILNNSIIGIIKK